MNALTDVRSPDIIAAEIGVIKGQTRDAILRSSVEIGRRLVEAKALLPHGEWGNWLLESVDYSQSTANNLMRIYEEYGNSQALGNLSYTKALALLGVPADEREQFATEHDAEHVSARELQAIVKAKHAVEKQLEETQKVADLNYASYREQVSLVATLTGQLEEAKRSGEDDEAQRLQEELNASQARITVLQTRVTDLKSELAAKPVDVGAVVEKIPAEVELELAELRKKAAQPSNQAELKFAVSFDTLVRSFQDILAALAAVEDPDTHEKYRKAVSGLLGKMGERVCE